MQSVEVCLPYRAPIAWLDAIVTSFKHSPYAACIVAKDGQFMDVNHAWCNMTGYSESELLAMRWQDITHPEDIEADEKNVKAVLTNDIPSYVMHKRYKTKSGTYFWVKLKVLGNKKEGVFTFFSSFAEPLE